MDTSELTGKISVLKVFKEQINTAIRDEQEAQRIYDKMISQADKADARVSGIIIFRKESYSSDIRGIRDQEHTHEGKFQNMLKNTEYSISAIERMLKDEQRKKDEERRKKEDDDRKKREDEQRRTSRGDAANLSEGYHGPYILRRG